MTFQLGEQVVYPNHGVGIVENISVRAFGPQTERFYLLKLQANSLTVMVPFSHVGHVGLRKVTKNGEVARVLEFLAAGNCKRLSDWKDRFKENSDKMQSGGLLDVAQVMKGLLVQQVDKPLSFREKKMLDRARHMLITEFTISRRLSTAAASELLEKTLQKSALHLPEPL